MENEIYDYEFTKMTTDVWFNGDEALCYCPICKTNFPTFKINYETKEYKCFNCGHSGQCDFITSKEDNNKIIGIHFIEID